MAMVEGLRALFSRQLFFSGLLCLPTRDERGASPDRLVLVQAFYFSIRTCNRTPTRTRKYMHTVANRTQRSKVEKLKSNRLRRLTSIRFFTSAHCTWEASTFSNCPVFASWSATRIFAHAFFGDVPKE
eukprot:724398-Rhodomonas_salina.1